MDNDRVRIYELSKELKLDNKELLAICNQLNIAVKSHSSTIRETDVERIREVAEKRPLSEVPSQKKPAAASPLAQSPVAAKTQSHPSSPHNPQILEIRKPKTLDRTNPNSKEFQLAARSPQSSLGSPVAPRPYSQPTAPIKPTPPTRPTLSTNQPQTRQVKVDADNGLSTNQPLRSTDATPTAIKAKAPAVAEQRPLTQPPTRPISPAAATPELNQPEQSEPKLDEVNQTLDQPVEKTIEAVAEKPVRPASVASKSEPETPKAQPILELQRPKPVRPVEQEAEAKGAGNREPRDREHGSRAQGEVSPSPLAPSPSASSPPVPPNEVARGSHSPTSLSGSPSVGVQSPSEHPPAPDSPGPLPLLEPEPAPVTTRPNLTVVAKEPKVVEEKRSEIPPKAEAVPEPQQLAKPPARPASPVAPTPEPRQPERSVPKPEKVKPAAKKPVETTKKTAAEKPVRPTKVASKSEPETPKPQQVVEIRRPKPARPGKPETPVAALLPKPSKATVESQAVGEESEVLLDTPEELMERPKLPRPVKAGKKRQEEEIDDGQESKAKTAKVGAKVKRLKPILEVDEEDWDDAELDLDAAMPANLAVARPARQKASPAKSPVTVAAAATAVKSKKFSRSRDRHRRHEVETKRERPEKVVVTGSMTVQELADALAVQDTEIVKILFFKGMAVSITQSLDIPTITLIGEELGVPIETAQAEAEARKVTEMLDVADLENLQRRPPVVTIMGHVDHGKTSLLDAIRRTKVAQGEAGGITQHIGAYHVNVESDGNVQQVVFLDTPGHEAFTAMRARGARVTDIAILVVAADDGVQPQTIEAISHAKAAEVPIVVAINKIDKPEAQPDRVRQELTEFGLVSEDWGGDTIMVPVSAIKRENLDTLLEMILLVAEVEDLQANPERAAKGTVIEANLDKTRGPVATLLVQNGTLRVGDIFVAGSTSGKVRAMIDDRGRRVEVATPSFAVEVLGLGEVPAAGDEFEVFQSEKEARAIATARADQQRQSRLMQGRISLATLSAQAQEGELKELNLILKADVQGSVEAIVGALKQLPQNEVQLRLLLAAPGEVTETDIDLAAASNAVIVGFNTTLASGAREASDAAGVDVREYNIIYKLLEDLEGAMEGLLEPELVEEALGQVEVRAVFPVGRSKIAGCYVLSGKVVRNCKLRVRRGGKVIYEGTIDSLKRIKDDVKEVNAGYECGIGVDKFNDWIEGDIMETYQMVTKRRTLSAAK
jgi:translation initiation factor IF-2